MTTFLLQILNNRSFVSVLNVSKSLSVLKIKLKITAKKNMTKNEIKL
jgi:hypothetical protein